MPGNIYDLLMGEPPQAEETARAMADQIRNNRQWALTGALGSPRSIQSMAGAQAGFAQQDQSAMEKGLAARMHYGMEAQRNKLLIAQTQGEYRLRAAMQALMFRQNMIDDKRADMLSKTIEKNWSPELQVRSAFGQAGNTTLQAVRGLALALRNGEQFNPNSVQQAELAGIIGRVVTGGVPGAHTLENMNPGSLQKTGAMVQQWMTGKPVPTDMREWGDQMLKMLSGEGDAAANFVRQSRLQHSGDLAVLARLDPVRASRLVSRFGLDKEHPLGRINPDTFEVEGFDPNAPPGSLVGGGGGGGGAPAPVGQPPGLRQKYGYQPGVTPGAH